MFGGRSNEVRREHVPKSYEIKDVDGVIEFKSYDGARINANCSAAGADCDDIDVGLYLNDVWAYELNCTFTERKPHHK